MYVSHVSFYVGGADLMQVPFARLKSFLLFTFDISELTAQSKLNVSVTLTKARNYCIELYCGCLNYVLFICFVSAI
jgi:hypothetical protein